MQGKRKSPFAGITVPLSDGNDPILYPRYTSPAELGLNASAPTLKFGGVARQPPPQQQQRTAPPVHNGTGAAANAGASADGAPVQKLRKKARWSDDRKDAAKKEKTPATAAPAALVGNSPPEAVGAVKPVDQGIPEDAKAKKKPAALRKLEPEERVSGPGNAEEAEKMRAALGFAAAPAAPGAFAFGFAGEAPKDGGAEPGGEDTSSEDSSDGEGEAAKPAAELGTSSEGTSTDGSDSDDGVQQQQQQQQQQVSPPAQPAATGPPRAMSDADSEYVPRRVYAGGMPFAYTEGEVREYWEYCGAVESLDLLTFPDTGRFRGIAFVTYATEEGYQAALGCDGQECDGQTLKVQKCRWSAKDRRAQQAAAHAAAAAAAAQSQKPAAAATPKAAEAAAPAPVTAPVLSSQHASPAPKVAGYNVAYVGNIAYEADEAALRALFEPYGVTKVRIHTDKDTGRPKGFAHVHFKDEASLDGAMVLDGTPLMGRRIRVGYAQQKKEQPPASAV